MSGPDVYFQKLFYGYRIEAEYQMDLWFILEIDLKVLPVDWSVGGEGKSAHIVAALIYVSMFSGTDRNHLRSVQFHLGQVNSLKSGRRSCKL
jgi:hypothetical protein